MKKLLILLLLPSFVSAQSIKIEKYLKVKQRESIWPHLMNLVPAVILSSGDTVVSDTQLVLGKGSLPNGDYNYIATPSNTMEAKLKRTTKLKKIWLHNIAKKGNKKYGYKYIFEAEGNYLIQLEDAIASGEILLTHD